MREIQGQQHDSCLVFLRVRNIDCYMTGDESLSGRPMDRVTIPLRKMSAKITSETEENLLPLKINRCATTAIDYENPVASAQVKSAILFAGSTSRRNDFSS